MNKNIEKTVKLISSPIILLDYGHGEDTPGKRSPDSRLLEWSFNRALGKIIEKKLGDSGFQYRVIVTEDNDISLSERCKRVNKICDEVGKNNCILLSIHGNAFGTGDWSNASGWQAHTTPGITESDVISKFLYKSAEESGIKVRKYDGDNNPDFENNFYILKHTKCPAVLIENLFYDNKKDIEVMLSEEGKEKLADIIVNGLKEYIKI